MTINQLKKYYKTESSSELARILGTSKQVVHAWSVNDKIPAQRQLEIQKLTKGKLKAGL